MNTIGINSISFGHSKAMRLLPIAIVAPLIAGTPTVTGSNAANNETKLFEVQDSTKQYENSILSHPKDGTIYVLPCYHPDLLNNINR